MNIISRGGSRGRREEVINSFRPYNKVTRIKSSIANESSATNTFSTVIIKSSVTESSSAYIRTSEFFSAYISITVSKSAGSSYIGTNTKSINISTVSRSFCYTITINTVGIIRTESSSNAESPSNTEFSTEFTAVSIFNIIRLFSVINIINI